MNKKLFFSALFLGAALTTSLVQAAEARNWWTDIQDAWAKATQQAEQYGKRAERPQTNEQYRQQQPEELRQGKEITRDDWERFKNDPRVQEAIQNAKEKLAEAKEKGKSWLEKMLGSMQESTQKARR